MRTHQWRLSFSRAETVLLNSWTPKQQIVYHILRFVLHESGLTAMRDEQWKQDTVKISLENIDDVDL
jgi:hypothetical protein